MLVLGAAGGVGLAAVDIAKSFGARVVAAVSTKEKAEVCMGYGVDDVVVYVEEKIDKEEQKAFEGTSSPPGSIVFSYGEANNPKWAETTFRYDPQPGYMWVFPAQLRHQVMPFHTPNVQRISVSGNLYLNPPNTPDAVAPKNDGQY